ncbi:MAG: glycosyltransferase family 4 protein [Candidatus Aureabacteria bacterium]|nr:glycosyltransferase family 4 protein [Candidatus Auribacterota bacterium]
MNADKLQIVFSGLLRSPASWATVSRHLLFELSKMPAKVKVIPKRGFLYSQDFPVMESIEKMVDNSIDLSEAAALCFDHPSFFPSLQGKIKAALLVYETFPLPVSWVRNINRYLDLVFVPNEFNRKLFVKSGVIKEKIHVIPYGYSPRLINQKGKNLSGKKEETRFLASAMPHKRKGVSFLVGSFCRAFSAKDNVSLTIKTTYCPKTIRKRLPWETLPVQDTIRRIKKKFSAPPRITCLEKTLSDEEMSGFYKNFDVYVQPSFAEGYGLAVLEAMASGLPCIVTGYGGHMDFCTPENALLIPYALRYRKGMAYDKDLAKRRTLVAVPETDHFVLLLKQSHKDPVLLRRLAMKAAGDVSLLTWENSAKRLCQKLLEAL